MSDEMRVLALDIETTPNLADVWGLWQQNVSIKQLRESTRVFCFGARWLGDTSVEIRSEFKDGQELMLERIHDLMDEADVIMGWNSKNFDVKHLNREFLQHGMLPPSPHIDLDLMVKTKAAFRFPSNKLDYVAQALGVGKKVSHEGHELWIKCMAGDAEAWERMHAYQKQDVDLLIDVYEHLQPWIKNHPNVALYRGEELACTACGSTDVQKRGFKYTGASKFQRFLCKSCGHWNHSAKRVATTALRG